MYNNLKLISPLKGNGIFSVHNHHKKGVIENSSYSLLKENYKPFKTQNCFLKSVKKNKIGINMNDVSKNRTNNSFKKNIDISYIPYPSFPNKNRIPESFRSSYNRIKYPKISPYNFTLYNNKIKTKKNIIFLNGTNTNTKIKKENNLDNKVNKTYYGNNGFVSLNQFFPYKSPSKNYNGLKNEKFNIEPYKYKKLKIKPKEQKINNLDNIIDNILHLVEMRDQNNNSILYTKVTNLLLDEMKKLFELQHIRNKLKRRKERYLSHHDKNIKKRRRELCLSGVSINRRLRSSELHKLIEINLYKKNRLKKSEIKKFFNYRRRRSEIPLLSREISFDNYSNSNYKSNNEYVQTSDSINKIKSKENYLKEKIRTSDSNKKNQFIINNPNNNNNLDINNILNKFNIIKKLNSFVIGNKTNNNISIFNNFIKDIQKKKQKKISIKQNLLQNSNLSNLLYNSTNKLDSYLNNPKGKIFNSVRNESVPLFEQMVKNDKLIKLIHEYLIYEKKYKEKLEKEEEKENEKEDEKEKNNNNENKEKDQKDNKEEEKIKECKEKEKEEGEEEEVEEDNIKNKDEKNDVDNDDKNKNNGLKEENTMNENITKNDIEVYEKNVCKLEKIEQTMIKDMAYTIKKIELGEEIVKHICLEIHFSKKKIDNLVNILSNLRNLYQEENRTEEEEKFVIKILKPINDILKEYLNNMKKINSSKKKPRFLFDKSLKAFFKKKMREILEIGSAVYYYEEKKEEKEKEKKHLEKEMIQKKEKKPEKRGPRKFKISLKKLIFDHSYFFYDKKKKKYSPKKSFMNLPFNSEQKDDDTLKKSMMESSSSFDFNDLRSRSISKYSRKSTKFLKIKKTDGLKKINDIIENEEKANNENEKKEDENDLKNEEILDMRLKAFFDHIRTLKHLYNCKNNEKLNSLIDNDVENLDRTKEKKIEERKITFFKTLKMERIMSKNEWMESNSKLCYQPPLIFDFYKNNENNENDE